MHYGSVSLKTLEDELMFMHELKLCGDTLTCAVPREDASQGAATALTAQGQKMAN